MQEEKIRWFHDMTWDEKESYIFNMIAWPVFILIYGYPLFPAEPSIFWTYVIVDLLITFFVRANKRKWIVEQRIEEEERRSGRTEQRICKLLEELQEQEEMRDNYV